MPVIGLTTAIAAGRPRGVAGGPDLRLTWAPPDTTGYTVISPNAGTSRQVFNLDNSTDYVVTMPDGLVDGAIQFNGGRNVVIIGGLIQVGPEPENNAQRRALYFDGINGLVHVEGVHFVNGNNVEYYGVIGFNVHEKADVIFQIQNCRFDGVTRFSGSPARFALGIIDEETAFDGEFRVDRVTIETNSEAINFINEGTGKYFLKRVNVTATTGDITDDIAYQFGQDWGAETNRIRDVTLEEVYVVPRPGRTFAQEFTPSTTTSVVTNRPVIEDGVATWPNTEGTPITGELREGAPPDGDWVTADDVGLAYTSPGYLP